MKVGGRGNESGKVLPGPMPKRLTYLKALLGPPPAGGYPPDLLLPRGKVADGLDLFRETDRNITILPFAPKPRFDIERATRHGRSKSPQPSRSRSNPLLPCHATLTTLRALCALRISQQFL